jgi:hypothetical protein
VGPLDMAQDGRSWRPRINWATHAPVGWAFIEYVDHLHDHYVDPVRIERGRYRAPVPPGFGAPMYARTRCTTTPNLTVQCGVIPVSQHQLP